LSHSCVCLTQLEAIPLTRHLKSIHWFHSHVIELPLDPEFNSAEYLLRPLNPILRIVDLIAPHEINQILEVEVLETLESSNLHELFYSIDQSLLCLKRQFSSIMIL
jgi:hypothetical protein